MFVSFDSLLLLLFSSSAAAAAAASEGDECVKGIEVPADMNATGWPTLFRLTTPNPDDPTASNMDNGTGLVDPAVLMAAGVTYRYLDPTGYDYPNRTKEIPWSPLANGTNDMALQQVRDEKDFLYADIVVVEAYAAKFYEEHIHAGGDEVRYVIDGSGYFDIRDVNDEWVRMHAKAGDFVDFPSGIEHRFAVDDSQYIQAMRLFPGSGEPDWSSVSRSEVKGNNTARNEYIDKYLCKIDPDTDHDHDHGAEDGEDTSSTSVSHNDTDYGHGAEDGEDNSSTSVSHNDTDHGHGAEDGEDNSSASGSHNDTDYGHGAEDGEDNSSTSGSHNDTDHGHGAEDGEDNSSTSGSHNDTDHGHGAEDGEDNSSTSGSHNDTDHGHGAEDGEDNSSASGSHNDTDHGHGAEDGEDGAEVGEDNSAESGSDMSSSIVFGAIVGMILF